MYHVIVITIATLLTSKLDQLTITDKGKVYSYTLLNTIIVTIYLVIVGAEAVAILSNRVRQINEQTRFMVDDDTWPPEQPKNFTPLLLLHYQGHRTPEQVTAMAELMSTGEIDKVALVTSDQSGAKPKIDSHKKFQKAFDTSKTTKQIEDILVSSQKTSLVLIEGAPGIGKSVLLKEIACRWAKKELLQNFELVLLIPLRDPSLQQVKSISNLLLLFYKGDDNATEIVHTCSEYLSKNGGKSVTLLLDGYDEYPSDLQKSSLIADIIKRQVLPLCGLVISSRPHASEHLRKQATIRVDILGFTEAEREHYITQALPDQPHKIKELTQYLHQQPSIDSICFIPFNMVILLYLYKLAVSLPKNCAELYHHFICFTICRYLSKFSNPLANDITNLSDLPEPYKRIIQKLSKLSLEALNGNKLIFTLDEITAACPDITTVPGAINGFGLLQAVQHFGLHTKTITLNFIHLTIQEFLAAHYICHLPPNEELKVIKTTFWSDIHFNVFSIYISLTKGQRPSFKAFLSGGNEAITISREFLKDQLKCLQLYRHFNEADDHTMCRTIEQAPIFNNKTINPINTILTASNVECISLFITSSFNKKWLCINLNGCYIQDKGIKILYHALCHSTDVTIDKLWLDSNDLTSQSASLIGEITVKCKIKGLHIDNNKHLALNPQLYSMLTNPSNTLESLDMCFNRLSSKAAIVLFTALKVNDNLKRLSIHYNDITDDACDAITAALEKNNCLVKLNLYGNPLSGNAIINIVQCLEVNNMLQHLGLPQCSEDVQENIRSLQQVINERRERQGCQMNLKIEFEIYYRL